MIYCNRGRVMPCHGEAKQKNPEAVRETSVRATEDKTHRFNLNVLQLKKERKTQHSKAERKNCPFGQSKHHSIVQYCPPFYLS